MKRETRKPKATETLTVTVHAKPGSPEPICPQSIKLTDKIGRVVWECEDLPPGAELLIAFREDPRGPFFVLEFAGNRVIGYGNRGPANTSRHYDYEAHVRTSREATRIESHGAAKSLEAEPVTPLGEGKLLNFATTTVDPPPGPPWTSSLTTPDEM